MKKKELNERQRRFADFYVRVGIGKEAARLAGYSNNTYNLDSVSSKLLKKEAVITEIDRKRKELTRKLDVNVNELGLSIKQIYEKLTHLAENSESDDVKRKSVMDLAKLKGLLVEKSLNLNVSSEAFEKRFKVQKQHEINEDEVYD